MKNKRLVLLFAALGLAGCSGNNGAGGMSGKVDCYSIKVVEGASAVFSGTYSVSYSRVYEYKSEDGKKIYLSNHFIHLDSSDYKLKESTIKVYPSKYTDDFIEYSYSRFVGFLTMENNYYLDLGARTIDSEVKWSEYKFTSDPVTTSEGVSDNKEAYNCAKSNYYYYADYQYPFDRSEFIPLRPDLTESSLERHTYTMLGQDSVITYTAKWF